MAEKSWKEMTPIERSAYMARAKERKRAERRAAEVSPAREMPEPDPDQLPFEEAPDGDPPPSDPVRDERRERLLSGIPAEIAALISDQELDEIEREERLKAEAERKEQALTTVRKSLRNRARVDNDLVDPSVIRSAEDRKRLARKVDFRFELPEGGDTLDGFRIDGHVFQNRVWHRNYPMAVVESLRANFYRTHLSEVQFSQMNQNKPGRRADQLLARNPPLFEVRDAA